MPCLFSKNLSFHKVLFHNEWGFQRKGTKYWVQKADWAILGECTGHVAVGCDSSIR